LAASEEFPYQIVNDDLETALDAIEKIIFQPLGVRGVGVLGF
jgi:guanylate kinase